MQHGRRSLTRIKRLVFIRHGEKLVRRPGCPASFTTCVKAELAGALMACRRAQDEDDNGKTSYLSTEGITRADNLYRVGPGS